MPQRKFLVSSPAATFPIHYKTVWRSQIYSLTAVLSKVLLAESLLLISFKHIKLFLLMWGKRQRASSTLSVAYGGSAPSVYWAERRDDKRQLTGSRRPTWRVVKHMRLIAAASDSKMCVAGEPRRAACRYLMQNVCTVMRAHTVKWWNVSLKIDFFVSISAESLFCNMSVRTWLRRRAFFISIQYKGVFM